MHTRAAFVHQWHMAVWDASSEERFGEHHSMFYCRKTKDPGKVRELLLSGRG